MASSSQTVNSVGHYQGQTGLRRSMEHANSNGHPYRRFQVTPPSLLPVLPGAAAWRDMTNIAEKNPMGFLEVRRATFRLSDPWLVVEPYPFEKYEFVSWDDEIPKIWRSSHSFKWDVSLQTIDFGVPLF